SRRRSRRARIRTRRSGAATSGAPLRVERVELVAPTNPTGAPLAREQIEVGPLGQRLDAGVDLVGLAAALADRPDDQLPNAPRLASRTTAAQPADLDVGASAVAVAEGGAAEVESPGPHEWLDDEDRAQWHPKEQEGVTGRAVGDRNAGKDLDREA